MESASVVDTWKISMPTVSFCGKTRTCTRTRTWMIRYDMLYMYMKTYLCYFGSVRQINEHRSVIVRICYKDFTRCLDLQERWVRNILDHGIIFKMNKINIMVATNRIVDSVTDCDWEVVSLKLLQENTYGKYIHWIWNLSVMNVYCTSLSTLSMRERFVYPSMVVSGAAGSSSNVAMAISPNNWNVRGSFSVSEAFTRPKMWPKRYKIYQAC